MIQNMIKLTLGLFLVLLLFHDSNAAPVDGDFFIDTLGNSYFACGYGAQPNVCCSVGSITCTVCSCDKVPSSSENNMYEWDCGNRCGGNAVVTQETTHPIASKEFDSANDAPINFKFTFYGQQYTQVFMSPDGAIGLTQHVPRFNVDQIPNTYGPMILPFWQEGHGISKSIFTSRVIDKYSTKAGDQVMLDAASNDIMTLYSGVTGFVASRMLIVSWKHYDDATNGQRNEIQLVIVTEEDALSNPPVTTQRTYAMFNYQRLRYSVGVGQPRCSIDGTKTTYSVTDPFCHGAETTACCKDNNGNPINSYPVIGFDSGDGVNYFNQAFSKTTSPTQLASASNTSPSNFPGRLIYQIDTATIIEKDLVVSDNAFLSLIDTDLGTISPAFAPTTYSYTWSLAAGDLGKIRAYRQNQYATITLTTVTSANQAYIPDTYTVDTFPTIIGQTGETIVFDVVAEDQVTTTQYTITVNILKDTNSRLANLTIGGLLWKSPVDQFTPGTLSYYIEVGTDTPVLSVTATPESALSSQICIGSICTTAGQGTAFTADFPLNIALNQVAQSFEVNCYAEDPAIFKTYVVTAKVIFSVDTSLQSFNLGVVPYTLSGTAYTATVDYNVPSVTLTLNPTHAAATVTTNINGLGAIAYTPNSALTVNVGYGVNTVVIVVKAEDTTVTATYTVTITRLLNTDSSLQALSIKEGTLNYPIALTPAFNPSITSYTATIDYFYFYISLSAFKGDTYTNTATMTYLYNTYVMTDNTYFNAYTFSKSVFGATFTIEVEVVAQDLTKTKYSIVISRNAVPALGATTWDPNPVTCVTETVPIASGELASRVVTLATTNTFSMVDYMHVYISHDNPNYAVPPVYIRSYAATSFYGVSLGEESLLTLVYPTNGYYDVVVTRPQDGGPSYNIKFDVCSGDSTALNVDAVTTGLSVTNNHTSFYHIDVPNTHFLPSLDIQVIPSFIDNTQSHLSAYYVNLNLPGVTYPPSLTFPQRSSDYLGGFVANNQPDTNGHYLITSTLPVSNSRILVGVFGSRSSQLTNAQGTYNFDIDTIIPTPVITGVTPSSGKTVGGTQITLTGSNFEVGTTSVSGSVVINNVICTSPSYVSGKIVCLTPEGQGKLFPVSVTLYGHASANWNSFSYTAPLVTSISCSTTLKRTAGNYVAIISGSNFGPNPTVFFDTNKVCTNITVSPDHGRIECIVPEGEGTVNVDIDVGGQKVTSTFTYEKPSIVSFTATSHNTDGTGVISFIGDNFGTSAAVVSVKFHMLDGTLKSCTSITHTHTTLSCTIPQGVGADIPVVITVDGASSDKTNQGCWFTYSSPVITNISPNPVTTLDTSVTIDGSNFGLDSLGSLTVTLLGGTCTVTSRTHNSIVCNIPSRLSTVPGAVVITVQGQTNPVTYSLPWASPTISGIDKTTVASSGEVVRISGNNLYAPGCSVIVDGTKVIIPSTATEAYLDVAFPAGSGASHSFVVSVGGLVTGSYSFSYTAPSISGITFKDAGVTVSNPNTAGTSVAVISGLDFSTSGSVYVSGKVCSLVGTGWSATSIECTFPSGQATVFVEVQVSLQTSNSYSITYAGPVISTVSPMNIPTNGDTLVAIDGKNFGYTQDSILINNKVCTIISWSNINIVCKSPAGRGEFVSLVVTVDGLSDSVTNFAYEAPSISAVTAVSFPTLGNVEVTISGSSFDVIGNVTVGGNICNINTWGHSIITCMLPEGQGINQAVVVNTTGHRTSTNFNIKYDAPSILSVSPTSVNSLGQRIDITGTNLGSAIVDGTSVWIDGTIACNIVSNTLTHNSVGCTISAVPTSGTPSVTVDVSGRTSTAFALDVDPPFITSINPTHDVSGPVDGSRTILTVYGNAFGDGSATTELKVGSAIATNLVYFSDRIECTLPAGIDSQVITVTVGNKISNGYTFIYDAPIISSVTPNISVPTSGQNIVIDGTSFGATPTVYIGGVVCPHVSRGHTSITCALGAGTGKNLVVYVLAGTQSSNTDKTLSYGIPTISDVQTVPISPGGNENIVITGTNFGPLNAPYVTIDGLYCTANTNSHTQITCKTPAGSGLSNNVIVTVGSQASLPYNIAYSAPFISTITPALVTTAGSVYVTLTGTSFGSSGTISVGNDVAGVMTNSKPCSIIFFADHTNSQIKCLIPAGQGTVSFQVTIDGQKSNMKTYTYGIPSITSITPTVGPTVGDFILTLTGSNFGSSGTVTVGSKVCTPISGRHSSTSVACTMTPNIGGTLPVVINTGTQSSVEVVDFVYNSPTISSFSPLLAPTNGNSGGNTAATFSIFGNNFGESGTNLVVKMNNINANVTFFNHTLIQVENIPHGTGAGNQLYIEVETKTVTTTYDYAAPQITQLRGCNTNNGATTENCAVVGGDILSITGNYFGSVESVIYIYVDGKSCPIIANSLTAAGDYIECTMPAGKNFGLIVSVVVDSQQSNQDMLISYAGPLITDNTICDFGSCVQSNYYYETDISSSRVIALDGAYFGTNCKIKYGPYDAATASSDIVTVGNNMLYTCASSTCTNLLAKCTLKDSTVGENLHFIVYDIDTDQYSPVSNDHLNTTIPSFKSQSIRSPGDVTGSSNVIGTYDNGEVIEFDVYNVGRDASMIKVYQGVSTFTDECTSVQVSYYNITSKLSTLRCTTAPGSDYVYLKVSVNGLISDASTDTFSYPLSPVVTGVHTLSGLCSNVYNGVEHTVADCPTIGGDRLNISGLYFNQQATAKIGVADCLAQTITVSSVDPTITFLECTLPAGAGLDSAITVLQGGNGLISRPKFLLSYAAPAINKVTGCTDSGTTTTECDRFGSFSLTLTGSNFGSRDALVFVGGQQCVGPTHNIDHTQVVCTVGPGVGLSQSVLLVQNKGTVSSTNGLLSYSQCQPGFYEADDFDYSCSSCVAGQYSAVVGAKKCEPCDSGYFSSVNEASSCSSCDPGSFSVKTVSASVGPTSCTPCDPGYYGNAFSQASCFECPPGTYQPGSGQQSCISCAVGTATASTAATVCDDCVGGFYAQFEGTVTCKACAAGYFSGDKASSCQSCDPGWYQPFEGQSDCLPCDKGFVQSASGQASCLACDSGYYAAETNMSSCSICLAGTYSKKISGKGATSCINCDAGSFTASNGLGECTLCDRGFYEPNQQSSGCSPCEAGKYTNLAGALECTNCTSGTYSVSGSIQCSNCPAGKISSKDGAGSCVACDAGSYTSAAGESVCALCPAGRVQSSTGQVSCQACDVGYYAPNEGMLTCSRCLAGTYSSKQGSIGCTACVEGEFTSSDVQSAPTTCPAGSYSNIPSATTCLECAAGRYTTVLTGAIGCTDCPKGYYSSVKGSGDCSVCAAGSYSTQGSTTCTLCVPGEFQAGSGKDQCSTCAIGKYTSSHGNTACLNCAIGKYQGLPSASTCIECNVGKYQDQVTATVCKNCTAGTANSFTGQSQCPACAVGEFASGVGSLTCEKCLVGTYAKSSGLESCISCPTGKFASSTGTIVCSDCEIGTYASAENSQTCDPCPQGYSQSLPGAQSCDICPPGKSQGSQGQPTCSSCEAGSYASGYGNITCELCPEGTYAQLSMATGCDLCPAGKYTASIGSISCKTCPAGKISATDGSNICESCVPGKYKSASGSSSCDICPKGYSQPSYGATTCVMCAAGEYANTTQSSGCEVCPAGSACVAGSHEPVPCLAGTYTSAQGLSKCVSCDPGYAANGVENTGCTACVPGTFASLPGSSQCEPCTSGRFAYGSASLFCELCNAGKYAFGQNSVQCTACEIGKFQSNQEAASCEICPKGTYAAYEGLAACVDCKPGEYAPDTNSSVCTLCDAGRVQVKTGQSTCSDCNPGQVMASTGQAVCFECDAGTFSQDPKSDVCTKCPVGKFSVKDVNGNGPSVCTDCAKGKFASAEGMSECKVCPVGTYSDTTGNSECKLCPEGQFAQDTGRTSCSNCPAGTFTAINGTIICTDCEAGKFQSLAGQTECSKCNEGTFQNSSASVDCYPCKAGTYASSKGAVQCSLCEPGYFNDLAGQPVCRLCTSGTYQAYSGSMQCDLCTAGKYMPTLGQASCLPCDTGTFSNIDGAVVCDECLPGTFQSLTEQSTCDLCPAGKSNSAYSQSSCEPCARGTYSAADGASLCTKCELGTFQPNQGMDTCDVCPSGKYGDQVGLAECTLCAMGTYAAKNASTACSVCALGSYQINLGQSQCDLCPKGEYTATYGRSSCTKCNAGSFNDVVGSVSCVPCDTGTYQDTKGQSACSICSSGKFAQYPQSIQCSDCNVGTFQNSTGKSFCSTCSPGTSQASEGSSSCIDCSAGRFAVSKGSEVCLDCDPGKYGIDVGMTQCLPCDQGFYSATKGAQACSACVEGRYQPYAGQVECVLCGTGSYNNRTAATECLLCETGTYQNSKGSQLCLECSRGSYADVNGTDVCKDCPSGRYQMGYGSSSCDACAAGTFTPYAAAVQCTECFRGYYQISPGQEDCFACTPGTFANETGTEECSDCKPGYYQSVEAQQQCLACGVGSYSPTTRSAECYDCEAGRYQNLEASSDCIDCPAGYAQSEVGMWACNLCMPGTYAPEGSSTCRDCPSRTVAPFNGSESCYACDANADASPDRTSCLCDIGYAGRFVNTGAGVQVICSLCPEGAVCDARGTMWDTMAAAAGYWGAAQGVYYRCLYAANCEGGNVLTDTAQCGANRFGPICAQCLPNYNEQMNNECLPCGDTTTSVFTIFLVCFLGFGALMIQYYLLLLSSRPLLMAAQQQEAMKKKAAEGFINNDEFEGDFDTVSDEELENMLRYEGELTIEGSPSARPDFSHKLKIFLGFIQIITNLTVGLDIQWPIDFVNFVNFFNPANLDFVQLAGVDCVQETNYWWKLYAWSACPAMLIVFLFVFYMLPIYSRNPLITLQEEGNEVEIQKRKNARKRCRRNMWRLSFFTLFLIYPSVSSTILRSFVCREIEGTWYLQADFAVKCFEGDYYTHATFAAIMFFVYPVGIPSFFLFCLYSYKKPGRLGEFGVRAQLGFLYEAFDLDKWWFDLVDMLHKLAVTSLIAFFPYEYQMGGAMVIVFLYTFTILIQRPYLRKGDDRLHLVAQTELLLLLLSGHVFNAAVEDPDPVMDIIMSFFLITICVGFFLYFIAGIFNVLKKLVKKTPIGRKLFKKELEKDGKRKRRIGSSLVGEMFYIKRDKLGGANRLAAGIADEGQNMDDNSELVRNPLWEANSDGAALKHESLDDVQLNPLHVSLSNQHDSVAHERHQRKLQEDLNLKKAQNKQAAFNEEKFHPVRVDEHVSFETRNSVLTTIKKSPLVDLSMIESEIAEDDNEIESPTKSTTTDIKENDEDVQVTPVQDTPPVAIAPSEIHTSFDDVAVPKRGRKRRGSDDDSSSDDEE